MTDDLVSATRAIDLSECENERICHLGLIQPHGYLLAFDAKSEITNASENIGQHLQAVAREALGQSLAQVLGPKSDAHIKAVVEKLSPGQLYHEFWDSSVERHSLWVHQRNSKYLLEWERLFGTDTEPNRAEETSLVNGLKEIGNNPHIHRQAQVAAELTAQLTGYDRVMVYRFHPDWSGEVIAEVRQPQAEPLSRAALSGFRYSSASTRALRAKPAARHCRCLWNAG